jgi:hypothetical protein
MELLKTRKIDRVNTRVTVQHAGEDGICETEILESGPYLL